MEQRVFDEVYTSDAFLEEHNKLQNSPLVPGCTLPRAILALMFMSDATHLAQFGDASLWPVYLAFGNQRKYERCHPSMHATHHVVYLKKLPAEIIEFICQIRGGKGATSAIITHCWRELFHAMIKLLLDPAFVYAWKHGIVVKCYDGITRQIYFRLFTWSADYPEKVLLATIRDGGNCLCPRCLVEKSKVPLLGSVLDMGTRVKQARIASHELAYDISSAQRIIYEDGYVVNSKVMDGILKEQSYVPTENAFWVALKDTDFDFFKIFVVDQMHEFELSVWKAFFIHLLRILYTGGNSVVQEMDERFRKVPAFGRGTIRRFTGNVSELKKLAARNYEDILQCVIPVFDGLLKEPHNTQQ
ncbi:hypothetical protein M422DRAFT_276426 [Sphaerobolus stellatus SS14]|uniref:Uncharacterized protein n=1 Tax=Sphaerobolus stellatus (strain SS14) TaxID=990650 RepID=A0A0C9UC90_SPHS4|nr:hypothetical protein M422DRAFT_276426 [Sphaerobolus stellatus SS14]